MATARAHRARPNVYDRTTRYRTTSVVLFVGRPADGSTDRWALTTADSTGKGFTTWVGTPAFLFERGLLTDPTPIDDLL